MEPAIETHPTNSSPRTNPGESDRPIKEAPRTTGDDVDWFSPPATFVDVGHSRVALRSIGTGPDVLFVHGWPLHGATFRCLLHHLTDAFTCHVIDLPGTGFSTWDEGGERTPISIRDHARTVQRIIEELGFRRYAMVGHDSGATIMRLVAADDDRVTGLVLGNTEIPGHHPVLLKLILLLNSIPGGLALFPLMLRVSWLRRSPLLLGGCFRDPRYADGMFHRLFIEPVITSKRTAAGQMRLIEGFDWAAVDALAELHKQIHAPVQLIWGTEDPFFPLRHARPMMDQFPCGAELVTIDGGKLFVHEESADLFGAATRGFLERCFS